ncbi:MAG: bacillithiol system redox-active protein YtxJ [Bacteroidia bacterium]|nr:bacillithiol system redox-active protein YtxJ [Bacteroidia bacterium]
MNWNQLTSKQQLDLIDEESKQTPVLLFKHSTRCSISSTALSRLERKWQEADGQKMKPYYLDLLQHRDVSNCIASHYGVEHQSPQALIISNGKCVYSATHLDIFYDEIITSS